MRLYRILSLLVAAQLLWAATIFAQDYKTQAASAPPSDVPKAIQDMLDAQGVGVVDAQGAPLCEIWLRKSIPANPSPSTSADILNGGLAEGTFIGVVHFPKPAADFRGQPLKPGFYTLRYALIPQDGNHMGVNPYRDAVVLGPVAADTAPDAVLKFDGLVKLSRQASGTPHPALLVMAQVNGDTFPSAVKDDQGHWDLQLKAHVASGDLPIALTVVGKWQG
jgi:hypothetical protein